MATTTTITKKRVVKKFESYLSEIFGYKAFKDKQRDVIEAIVKKKQDVCCIMATGHGKSVCYQLPPVILQKPALVISPLLSLMEDQRVNLDKVGIKSCCYNSTIKGIDKMSLYNEIVNGEFQLIYITPETIVNSEILLKTLHKNHGLSVIAIDESHCVSLWGQSFRPAYTELSCLKKWLPNVPILALTGTATPTVEDDIIKSLCLKNPLKIRTTSDRVNLSYYVHSKTSPLNDLKPLVTSEKIIIYCQTCKETEEIATLLVGQGIACEAYHAKLPPEVKNEAHHNFLTGKTTCISATISFGMGIDVSNIYTIIHYGCPKDIESYCQEAGRAGRDGKPSQCHVFYKQDDFATNRFFIKDIEGSMKDHKEKMITAIEKYLYTTDCRRQCLLEYFGEKKGTSASSPSTLCCDNCINTKTIMTHNWGYYAKLFLEFVQDLSSSSSKSYGKVSLINSLIGVSKKDTHKPLISHRHYGVGHDHSQIWWRNCVQQLANEGLIIEKAVSSGFGSVVEITHSGIQWLTYNQFEPTFIVKNHTKDETPQQVVKIDKLVKSLSVSTSSTSSSSSNSSNASPACLSPTVMITYNLFHDDHKSIQEIAKIREYKLTTIEGHIATCVENGCQLDFKRLGMTREIYDYIINIIQSEPLNGDISKLKPIKELCKDEITYSQIKYSLAILSSNTADRLE